ncbi:hypothetical protein N8508_00355 [bacterium]|nr:hypothetical protein [bacterium]
MKKKDGFYKATIEALHYAHINTEIDCVDYGIIMELFEDGKALYTDDAKRMFNVHYKTELNRLGYGLGGERIKQDG